MEEKDPFSDELLQIFDEYEPQIPNHSEEPANSQIQIMPGQKMLAYQRSKKIWLIKLGLFGFVSVIVFAVVSFHFIAVVDFFKSLHISIIVLIWFWGGGGLATYINEQRKQWESFQVEYEQVKLNFEHHASTVKTEGGELSIASTELQQGQLTQTAESGSVSTHGGYSDG